MELIDFVIRVIIVIFAYIAITKIYRYVANLVGEQLGFGKFIIYLWRKIRRKEC
jgi:hypothetical protein